VTNPNNPQRDFEREKQGGQGGQPNKQGGTSDPNRQDQGSEHEKGGRQTERPNR